MKVKSRRYVGMVDISKAARPMDVLILATLIEIRDVLIKMHNVKSSLAGDRIEIEKDEDDKG